jgi:hypothetical protein
VLFIGEKHLLLDVSPIAADQDLHRYLGFKRELEAELGSPPKRHLVVQVDEQVLPDRVERLLKIAREHGYWEVTRMNMKRTPAVRRGGH